MEIFNQIVLSRRDIIGASLLLLLLSIICQIMIGVLYQNMIKQADNMAATTNKVLKQCKLKFSHCYQMNMGAVNVGIFVDKFMNKLCIGRMSLSSLGHLSGQLILASIFVAGLGACKGIIDGLTLGAVLPYYLVSIFNLYVYFSISSLVDISGKRQSLKTCIADYLENHMMNHLSVLNEQGVVEETISGTKAQENTQSGTAQSERQTADGEDSEGVFTGKEEAELTQLIREFLA